MPFWHLERVYYTQLCVIDSFHEEIGQDYYPDVKAFYCQVSQAPHIDGLVQNCSISIADALEILQSCTKPST